MQIYSDYRSLAGKWYTFRPLSVISREELARRFNSFNRALSIKSQLSDDEDGAIYWNLSQILKLYGLTIDEFEIEELDTLLVDHLLRVNYGEIDEKNYGYEKQKSQSQIDPANANILADLISGTWGITESAGDAMYLVKELPAELLIETIKKRAEALERIYATDEDKRKKQTGDIKNQLKDQMLKNQNKNK